MIFLDTSVLLPAVQTFHENHKVSHGVLAKCDAATACTGDHALAELYSKLTGIPKPWKLSPRQAEEIVMQMSARLTLVALDSEETVQAIRSAAGAQIAGATIYDALLVARARKAEAELILTYNVAHFRRVAPDLAEIIREP